MKFENILIWPKKNDGKVQEFSSELANWLISLGKNARILNDYDLLGDDSPDLVISLGGDGTILGLARFFAGKNIPIFGINFGHVGYLCNTDVFRWQKDLANILKNQVSSFTCLALAWRLARNGKIIAEGVAANDVVLSRATLARLISVTIRADDFNIGVLRGDGLICSTPLGSSGYNISAGGSILQPDLAVYELTPICPFVTKIAPMIFAARTRLAFRVLENPADCFVTIDGQEGQKLRNGDIIEVQGRPDALTFLGEPFRFFERLRQRGFILE